MDRDLFQVAGPGQVSPCWARYFLRSPSLDFALWGILRMSQFAPGELVLRAQEKVPKEKGTRRPRRLRRYPALLAVPGARITRQPFPGLPQTGCAPPPRNGCGTRRGLQGRWAPPPSRSPLVGFTPRAPEPVGRNPTVVIVPMSDYGATHLIRPTGAGLPPPHPVGAAEHRRENRGK